MKPTQWLRSGNNYRIGPKSENVDKLEAGVYRITEEEHSDMLFLVRTALDFELPAKIFQIDADFIRRVTTYYAQSKGNLGVLLAGIKGSGKSVTAKQICNGCKLPVIIVDKNYGRLPAFLNDIQQDIVVLIDEFEKIFKQDNSSDVLLPLMDGVMSNGSRRLFLLTSNSTMVSSFLLSRPGRIRYVRNYEDLSADAVIEIVDDKLKHKHLRSAVLDFLSRLDIITIDIVQAVVEEVNLFEEDPVEFEDVFNVSRKEDEFDLFERKRLEDGTEEDTLVQKKTFYSSFDDEYLDHSLRTSKRQLGSVSLVMDKNTVVTTDDKGVEHVFFIRAREAFHKSFRLKKK